MEYILVVCILLLILSIFINYNLYVNFKKATKLAMDNEDFIFSIRNRVLEKQSELKAIDRRGSFEADDEVGFIFKDIQRIINDIAIFLDLEVDDDGEKTSPYGNSILANRLRNGATIRGGE
ncbi:hypothetical protein [Microcystis phage Mel-JY01]